MTRWRWMESRANPPPPGTFHIRRSRGNLRYEEVLKRHAAVRDAVCVGVPDERFGQAIVALIELDTGASDPGTDALAAHVKDTLAHYKAPRHTIVIDTIGRAANGKVDYKGLTDRARQTQVLITAQVMDLPRFGVLVKSMPRIFI